MHICFPRLCPIRNTLNGCGRGLRDELASTYIVPIATVVVVAVVVVEAHDIQSPLGTHTRALTVTSFALTFGGASLFPISPRAKVLLIRWRRWTHWPCGFGCWLQTTVSKQKVETVDIALS